ncbi:MAG: hypothetical protein Q8P15_03200, partial [Nanoarchaeota archaeon]|nr:hypothetical protein [Nanoarchaeota archaeon]
KVCFNIYELKEQEKDIKKIQNIQEDGKVILDQGSIVEFSVKEEKHSLIVNDIFDDKVNITIHSSPINFIMLIGETKKIDFENDGFYDLEVKFSQILGSKVVFDLKDIVQEEPEEIPVVEEPTITPPAPTFWTPENIFFIILIIIMFWMLLISLLLGSRKHTCRPQIDHTHLISENLIKPKKRKVKKIIKKTNKNHELNKMLTKEIDRKKNVGKKVEKNAGKNAEKRAGIRKKLIKKIINKFDRKSARENELKKMIEDIGKNL